MTKKYKYKEKENGKNDTGRPTDYRPKYAADIVSFFINAPRTERVVKSTSTGKNDFEKTEYIIIPCPLPTIAKFARHIKVAVSTIYKWEQEFSEFSEALKEVREIYKEFLNDNALCGYYNPLYAKFVATNTTDMKDKTETDVSVKSFEHFKKEKDEFAADENKL